VHPCAPSQVVPVSTLQVILHSGLPPSVFGCTRQVCNLAIRPDVAGSISSNITFAACFGHRSQVKSLPFQHRLSHFILDCFNPCLDARACRQAGRLPGRCVLNNHQLAILSTFPHFRTFVKISGNFFSRHQSSSIHPSSDSAPFLRSSEQCYTWLLHVLLFWRTLSCFPYFVCIVL